MMESQKKRAWLTELEKEDRTRSPACIVFGRQRSWTVGEKSMGKVSSIPYRTVLACKQCKQDEDLESRNIYQVPNCRKTCLFARNAS